MHGRFYGLVWDTATDKLHSMMKKTAAGSKAKGKKQGSTRSLLG